MANWNCTHCGSVFAAEKAPEQCPSCKERCTFTDVTCYVPECGGPESGNIDPRLVQGDRDKKPTAV